MKKANADCVFVLEAHAVNPTYDLHRAEPCEDTEHHHLYLYTDSEGYNAYADEADIIDIPAELYDDYIKTKEAWDKVQERLYWLRCTAIRREKSNIIHIRKVPIKPVKRGKV
jgi:hypothetical protein